MTETFKIFYSWQSDLPNSTNRSFIEEALKIAIKSLRNDDSIELEPVIDRDTIGVSGSPNIATTILEKIENADMFVCDVSIINQGTNTRPVPNPNVLIELGYALKSLGTSRILMVQNTAYGKPEALPFDLKMNRATSYFTQPEDNDKSAKRKALAKQLESAIKLTISQVAEKKAELKETYGDTVKRLLSSPNQNIQLHDFIMQEANQAAAKIRQSDLVDYTIRPTQEIFLKRVEFSETTVKSLIEIFVEACRWVKEEEQVKFFGNALLQIFMVPGIANGHFYNLWPPLAHYPALLLLYAGGIAALSKENFIPIRHFSFDLQYRDRFNNQELMPIIFELNASEVFGDAGNWLPGMEQRHIPASDYLHDVLRPYFALLITDDDTFSRTFDRFEYYLSLVYGLHRLDSKEKRGFWTPVGAFIWRGNPDIAKEVGSEIERKKEKWQPLNGHLFDVQLEKILEAKALVDDHIQKVRNGKGIWI